MAWNSPLTAVANTTLTAAQWNTFIRDNLNAQAPALANTAGAWLVSTGLNTLAMRVPAVDYQSISDSTTSTSFGDLDPPGGTVTVVTGPQALVTIGCQISNSTAGCGGRASVDLSGATERVADDINVVGAESGTASDTFKLSWTTIYTPINPGTNIFAMKYRASIGGTATFSGRLMSVVPF